MASKNMAIEFNKKLCVNLTCGSLKKPEWLRKNRKRKAEN